MIEKLYDFKEGFEQNIVYRFFCGFQNFRDHLHFFFLIGPYIFFIVNRKNINVGSNLIIKEVFYDNLSRG